VKLRGVPRGRCVARAFTLHARATAPARRVTVYVDGRRIAKTAEDKVVRRVVVRGLDPGRHRVKAIARDLTGDVAVARARFRRC
jgi:hypothetical protein